jgi:ABC-type nitrate/sulfonate/bicarbonate transport system substrate-binding protein
MDRRSFIRGGLFAVTSAAGGTLLVACGNGSTPEPESTGGASARDLENLVYVTPFQHIISHADVYVAIQEGYFEDVGLLITPVGGTGTASSVSQVTAGQGMFGKAASVVTAPLIADQGAEIITVGQKDQRSQYSVASSPDKPLEHPKDWQGKSIGVISKGGATELLLDAMSVAAGLDPANVNKVVTGADVGSLEFLRRGEVDGFITFIGSETAFKQMKVDLFYLNSDKFAKLPGDSYFVKKKDAEEQPETVTNFLGACRKGWEFMADSANIDAVLSAVAEFNPIEVQDEELAKLKVDAEVKLSRPENGEFLSIDVATWEEALQLMRQANIVKDTSRPISDFVTAEYIDAV